MRRYIEKVWVDDNSVFAKTTDGEVASYPFAMWDRLRQATKEQREDFYLTYSGIHWPQIDEDLSFEGMFNYAGICELSVSEDNVCYISPNSIQS